MKSLPPLVLVAALAFIPANHAFPPPIYLASPQKIAPTSNARKSILQRIATKGGNIRGDRYGTANNSTILAPSDAAIKVGVEPTMEASKEVWQRAWRIHRFMLPILYRFDRVQSEDVNHNLACLWWKAIAGNDLSSPVYDYQLSYDLLPPISRGVVHRSLCHLYPRLHHANVEIR